MHLPSRRSASSPRLNSPCGSVSCSCSALSYAPGSNALGFAVAALLVPPTSSTLAVPLARVGAVQLQCLWYSVPLLQQRRGRLFHAFAFSQSLESTSALALQRC